MSPKKYIDEFFNRAEKLVNDFFGFFATSCSGSTKWDKRDGKGKHYRVEVKATHKGSKSIALADFKEWELSAAKDRKKLIAVVVFVDESGQMDINNSYAVVNTRWLQQMIARDEENHIELS